MAQALRAPVGEADFLNDQLLDLNTPLAQAISTAGADHFKTAAAPSDPAPDDEDSLGLGSSLPLSLSAALVAPHEIALAAVSHNAFSRIETEGPTRTAPGSATGVAPAAPGPAGALTTLATYLTTGFWSDFSGAAPRSFNLGSPVAPRPIMALFITMSPAGPDR